MQSHRAIEVTIYLPGIEDPIVVPADRVVAVGTLPGTMIPFVDIKDPDNAEEFDRYTGMGLVQKIRLGPVPLIAEPNPDKGKIILPSS